MAERKIKYTAYSAPAFAVQSLGSSSGLTAGYESGTVDNTSNLYIDYAAKMEATTGTSPTDAKSIELWVIPAIDGSDWPDVFDGTTSAETVTSRDILFGSGRLAASVKTDNTSDRHYELVVPSVAALFDGFLPQKFVFFLVHDTGVNLNSTAGNHVLTMVGGTETVA